MNDRNILYDYFNLRNLSVVDALKDYIQNIGLSNDYNNYVSIKYNELKNYNTLVPNENDEPEVECVNPND